MFKDILQNEQKRNFNEKKSVSESSSDDSSSRLRTPKDTNKMAPEEEATLRAEVADQLGHNISPDKFKGMIDEALDVMWVDLVRSPQPGSVIAFLSNHKNRTKTILMSFMFERIMKDLGTLWMSSSTPMDLYLLYRLTCPHPVAVAVAEYIEKSHLKAKPDTNVLELVGQLADVEVKDRQDLRKVFGRVTQYHPAIGDWVLDVFKIKF